MATIITSDSKIPIEESFKVSAGPGAGKTHWLVNHIKQVLAKSKRLGAVKKLLALLIQMWVQILYPKDCNTIMTV